MIKNIAQKMRNLIKIAQVTRPGPDSGIDSVSQVEYMGKSTDAAALYPYGMSANAPNGSSVLLLSLGGSAQNEIGIPFSVENRFRDLKSGEVKLGNFVTKAHVIFKEDGSIEIEAGLDGGPIRVSNGNGFIELAENGQVNINDNFTVDP